MKQQSQGASTTAIGNISMFHHEKRQHDNEFSLLPSSSGSSIISLPYFLWALENGLCGYQYQDQQQQDVTCCTIENDDINRNHEILLHSVVTNLDDYHLYDYDHKSETTICLNPLLPRRKMMIESSSPPSSILTNAAITTAATTTTGTRRQTSLIIDDVDDDDDNESENNNNQNQLGRTDAISTIINNSSDKNDDLRSELELRMSYSWDEDDAVE